MKKENVETAPKKDLCHATVQEIQLELIRRTQFNAFDGQAVVASLLAHQELWDAVLLDRFAFSRPGKLPGNGLIKLRDLSDNFWNADTLYILAPSAEDAKELAAVIEKEDWGGGIDSRKQLHRWRRYHADRY